MTARLRLAASYLVFLLIAGALFAGLLIYLFRFLPESGYAPLGPSRTALLQVLLPRAGQVLAVLTVLAAIGGWWLAGRMLRPLRALTSAARQVTGGSYDARVHLQGPADEFHELADAFDRMLDRTQAVLEEQRRFAANASHELRTPIAVARSLIEVALADPEAQDLTVVLRRLREINRRSAETLEALLTLSMLDELEQPGSEPIDLAELVPAVLADLGPMALAADVRVETRLEEADVDGEPTLVRQLLVNLILNAVRHNLSAGGWLRVVTASAPDGGVGIVVENTGAPVPDDVLATLTEPFVRGSGRIASDGPAARGVGLGLAICTRIVAAHRASMTLSARSGGGLRVEVRFPPPAAVERRGVGGRAAR